MKKFIYFLLSLSIVTVALGKDKGKKPQEIKSTAEIACGLGTWMFIFGFTPGCQLAIYLNPKMTLGLRYEYSYLLPRPPGQIVLATTSFYPMSGSYYLELGLGGHDSPYDNPDYSSSEVYIYKWDLAYAFRMGNRWKFSNGFVLGINYIGGTFGLISSYMVSLLSLGLEVGYRF